MLREEEADWCFLGEDTERIPMTLPPTDESFTGELAHSRCAELCEDSKHNNFVQLDAEVH